MSNSPQSQINVCAIGFDHLGYGLRPKTIDMPKYRLDLLSKSEAAASAYEYDVLIFPSGIFERHKAIPEKDGERILVESELDLIQKMERKIDQVQQRGGWVVFLVDEIIDRVNESSRATIVNDTDLCKRLLNRFQVQRNLAAHRTTVEVKESALESYAKDFAVAKTVFLPTRSKEIQELIQSSEGLCGFCARDFLYVLPFFKHHHRSSPLGEPLQVLIEGILNLRQSDGAEKAASHQPDWLKAFQFESERKLKEEQERLSLELKRLGQEIEQKQVWKNILVDQSAQLKTRGEEIFKDFFGLETASAASGAKDKCFHLKSKEGKPIALIMTETDRGEVTRSHINQLDSLREAERESPDHLGILLINDHSLEIDLQKREAFEVDKDKIQHARNLRILILRCMDLLQMIRQWEGLSQEKRREEFLREVLNAQGILQLKRMDTMKKKAI